MKRHWKVTALLGGAIGLALACSPDSDVDTGDGNDGSGAAGGSTGTSSGGNATGTESGTGTGTGMMGECTTNAECPAGSICENNECVAGCAADAPCQDGFTCCGSACVDVSTDIEHCGMCGNACALPPNVAVTCNNVCEIGACDAGFFDCDGDTSNGCESSQQCNCTPGETQNCYNGPPGTLNVGTCVAGTQQCNMAGTAWSLCSGAVVPTAEICANGLDEDCDGTPDNSADLDMDGWTVCEGDCCDVPGPACADPALVNPGAYEFVGNMVDDDCDPGTSDTMAPTQCSTAAKFTDVTAMNAAQAMDLCQTTTANPPLDQLKWGVISAQHRLANGATPSTAQLNNMEDWQTAVLTVYGTGGVVPINGPTMAAISSGRMRDQNDPGYVAPNNGTDFGLDSQPPASYLSNNGGILPTSTDCNGQACAAGSGANDPVNIRLQIRVPTNAQSFSYNFRFFSAEYWTYACTQWNDFYLAILNSNAPGIPADGNISFDALGNPVSVNNGFFQACVPNGCYTCPTGTGPLQGTGMQLSNTGGATDWLSTTAPVVPGEIITLELMVFDVSDNILDSLTLIDDFEWSIMPSGVGTVEE